MIINWITLRASFNYKMCQLWYASRVLFKAVFVGVSGCGVGIPRVQVLVQSRSLSFEGDSDYVPYICFIWTFV